MQQSSPFGRVKPLARILAEGSDRSGLKRTVGIAGLTALGIGCIIGAGIFVLTGVAAARYAGPGIVLSYGIAGLASALAALCYAELAGCVPIAGSAYTYAYATLGELVAWIVGWDLILEYMLGATTVSIGWSGYVVDAFGSLGITLPHAWTTSPFSGGIANLPAAFAVLALTTLLVRGSRESTTFNLLAVALKIVIVLFFLAVGVAHVHAQNWHPFLPHGITGMLTGASVIFFAYIGFDAIATSAEEAKNPQRTLPIGILASVAICTLLYIAVAFVLTGMIPSAKLDVASPVSFALLHSGLRFAGGIVAIGAIAGLTTVLLTDLFAQSRIFYAMSRDGLLPRMFSRVHPRFRTPASSTMLIGSVVAVAGAVIPIDVAGELVSIGTLVAFIIVAIGVVILRKTNPDEPRAFRVPGGWIVPALSIVLSLALIVRLPGATFVRFVVWFAIGLVVYWFYGRHKSALRES